MKALYLIAWMFAGIGFALVLFGTISSLYGVNYLHLSSIVNLFHVANSYFMMAIFLFIFVFRTVRKKE